MGGSNEKNLTPPAPQASSSPPTSPPPVQMSNLRIHENKGEVHIHDDANRKKVAVDVANFHASWSRFKASMRHNERMLMMDKSGNTAALFIANLETTPPDVTVAIVEVASSSNLAKIEAFVAGK